MHRAVVTTLVLAALACLLVCSTALPRSHTLPPARRTMPLELGLDVPDWDDGGPAAVLAPAKMKAQGKDVLKKGDLAKPLKKTQFQPAPVAIKTVPAPQNVKPAQKAATGVTVTATAVGKNTTNPGESKAERKRQEQEVPAQATPARNATPSDGPEGTGGGRKRKKKKGKHTKDHAVDVDVASSTGRPQSREPIVPHDTANPQQMMKQKHEQDAAKAGGTSEQNDAGELSNKAKKRKRRNKFRRDQDNDADEQAQPAAPDAAAGIDKSTASGKKQKLDTCTRASAPDMSHNKNQESSPQVPAKQAKKDAEKLAYKAQVQAKQAQKEAAKLAQKDKLDKALVSYLNQHKKTRKLFLSSTLPPRMHTRTHGESPECPAHEHEYEGAHFSFGQKQRPGSPSLHGSFSFKESCSTLPSVAGPMHDGPRHDGPRAGGPRAGAPMAHTHLHARGILETRRIEEYVGLTTSERGASHERDSDERLLKRRRTRRQLTSKLLPTKWMSNFLTAPWQRCLCLPLCGCVGACGRGRGSVIVWVTVSMTVLAIGA